MAPPTYPLAVMKRARELHEAGWNLTATAQVIARESNGLFTPSRNTIRRWVDPDYAEAERLAKQTGKPRKSRRKGWRFVFDRVRELRDLNLSYRAIAAVVSYDFDLLLTHEQVERMLQGRMKESSIQGLLWPKGASA